MAAPLLSAGGFRTAELADLLATQPRGDVFVKQLRAQRGPAGDLSLA